MCKVEIPVYFIDVPVYFEVTIRQGYETRPSITHVATFLKYADAKEVSSKLKDYGQPVGDVRPTFEKKEGFPSLKAYEDFQRERMEIKRQEKLEEVNTNRRKFGWEEFPSFEEMNKVLYKGRLERYGYEKIK